MNMSKKVSISFTWDKETYIQAAKAAYDYELKQSNRKYIGWFFIALTQFGVVAAMKKGAIGLLFISTFLVFYWYFLRWPLRKKMIEKTFDKLQNANHIYHITLTEDFLLIDEKKITYTEINEALTRKEGIFLYLDQDSLFIPNHAFDGLEEKNDFLNLLKEHVKNYTREK